MAALASGGAAGVGEQGQQMSGEAAAAALLEAKRARVRAHLDLLAQQPTEADLLRHITSELGRPNATDRELMGSLVRAGLADGSSCCATTMISEQQRVSCVFFPLSTRGCCGTLSAPWTTPRILRPWAACTRC